MTRSAGDFDRCNDTRSLHDFLISIVRVLHLLPSEYECQTSTRAFRDLNAASVYATAASKLQQVIVRTIKQEIIYDIRAKTTYTTNLHVSFQT